MSNRSFSLSECKIQASILLKELRYNHDSSYYKELKQLLIFNNLDNDAICKKVQLKHSLQIIASRYGFVSWENIKAYFEQTSKTMFNMTSSFLNQWFANYKEAKTYLINHPDHFLLPYKKHFVVCGIHFIEYLEFDITDNNWVLINHNWVEPGDYMAWQKLNNIYNNIRKGK